jgi:pyruvate kinase
MNLNFNKTKIIATIGPASSSKQTLKELILAGTNVCRINSSHGSFEHHQLVIDAIRELNEEMNLHTAILVDLQGPKLRIGFIENNEVLLVAGQDLNFTTEECVGTNERVFMTYQNFPKDVKPGEKILVDDGKLEFIVKFTDGDKNVVATCVNGGVLSSKKGVNLPHTNVSLPSLTEKDLEDLEFALKNNVDWIGLSFVRSAEDIRKLKQIISSKNKDCKVVAKIEKPEALIQIDEIIEETDALMVARGDLGVEIDMDKVPHIQKMLVRKCTKASKPVIIATQMMESMITNFSPTRAEVNDVANAVLDGADAVMLSGETSVGRYPVKVVEYMSKIIASAEEENSIYNRDHDAPIKTNPKTYVAKVICFNACQIAEQMEANAIVTMTHSGYTAYKISSYRPKANIFIFTDNKSLLTSLSLLWGVRGFYYDEYTGTDQTFADLKAYLKNNGYVKTNDIMINISSIPLTGRGRANMLKLSYVE